MRCPHMNFQAFVTVNRLEDSGQFSADIRIKCQECNEPFRFIGVPAGSSYERPMVSIDGLEMRAPIEPEIVKLIATKATFQVPPKKAVERA